MKYAADFRQEARAALQGKWPLAILVGLVAAILGGATSGGPEFKINFTGGSLNANIQYAGQTIYSWGGRDHTGTAGSSGWRRDLPDLSGNRAGGPVFQSGQCYRSGLCPVQSEPDRRRKAAL